MRARDRLRDKQPESESMMFWYFGLAYFFGGVFLANAVPYLVSGVSGRPLQSPFLARYPDSISGLGRWDLRGLHYVAQHSPNLVRAIGHMLGEVFDCDEDHVGDQWVYWRMRRLASATLAHPLLRFDRDSRAMSGRTVELTSAGRSVLDGEASFIQLNGLVDDIGGVSLNYPAEPIWLSDGETLVLHDKP